MSKQTVQNPWGLTCGEVDVMDAIAGNNAELDAVAEKLRISRQTMRSHTRSVRNRMCVNTTIRAAVLWALWRQDKGKGVPA